MSFLHFQKLRFYLVGYFFSRRLNFLQRIFKLFKLLALAPRRYVRKTVLGSVKPEFLRNHKRNGFSLNLLFVSGRFCCNDFLFRVVEKIVRRFVKSGFKGLRVAHSAFYNYLIFRRAIVTFRAALNVPELNVNARDLFQSRENSFFAPRVNVPRKLAHRFGNFLSRSLGHVENVHFFKSKSRQRLFNSLNFFRTVVIVKLISKLVNGRTFNLQNVICFVSHGREN